MVQTLFEDVLAWVTTSKTSAWSFWLATLAAIILTVAGAALVLAWVWMILLLWGFLLLVGVIIRWAGGLIRDLEELEKLE